MKILKYLLSILAVLVLLFFALGFMKPSVSYGSEVEINKPLKETWAVQMDVSKYGEWLDGFTSMEHLTGEKQAVGSTYKVIVTPHEGAEPFEMIETVKSFKEFEHVTLHFDSDMMDFEQTTSFSERDGKTVVKTDSKVIGKGIMMRSMFALMEMTTGSFTAQEAKNMGQFKNVAEANTTDYFPAPPEVISEETIEEISE